VLEESGGGTPRTEYSHWAQLSRAKKSRSIFAFSDKGAHILKLHKRYILSSVARALKDISKLKSVFSDCTK
jgi:UDP-N-acetylglucosamine pyrophosphorylase